MWAAFFQADGEMRYLISTREYRHRAEYDIEEFKARMSHPEIGVWFCWCEEMEKTCEPI